MNRITDLIAITVMEKWPSPPNMTPHRARLFLEEFAAELLRPVWDKATISVGQNRGNDSFLAAMYLELKPLFAEEPKAEPVNVWSSGMFLHLCGCVTSTDGGRLIATCTSPSRCTRVKK